MAVSLLHQYVSAIADSGDTSVVQPSNWNAEHTITMATNKLLGRGSASTGAVEEITLGTGLSFTGTTLNAAGGAPGGSDTYVQFNDGGSTFGGDSGLTFDKTNNALTVGGATVTTSNPVLNLSQTWNAGAVTFTGIKLNVTDTTSAAASLLVDLQKGGTSQFNVRKDGLATALYGFVAGAGAGTVAVQDGYGANGIYLGSAKAIVWSSGSTIFGTDDLFIHRDAANTLALRNSTTGQCLNIYNTYTDGNNYERAAVKWNTNKLEIGAEALGTGAIRALYLQPNGDDIYLGASSTNTNIRGRAQYLEIFSNLYSIFLSPGGSRIAEVLSTGFSVLSGGLGFSSGATNNPDIAFYRAAAGIMNIRGANSTTGGVLNFLEQTAPSAPSANQVHIYAQDNGAGKTQLMALFGSGAAQQIAIEP